MQKFIPIFIMVLCAWVSSGFGQSLVVKEKIAVPTIQCDGCAFRIENAVGQISGVKEATVDLDGKIASVVFDQNKTNLKLIEESIANVGYHANNTQRNSEAYAKLPMCCKEPKDQHSSDMGAVATDDSLHSHDQQVHKHDHKHQPISGRWEERDKWQNVPGIFEAMALEEGSRVADVGAGFGYLTMQLASAVGAGGKVLAVDVDEHRLNQLRTRLQKNNVENVTVVRGEIDNPKLQANALDAAVIVDSYHEMSGYKSMLQHLIASLKPGGRLVLVEPISKANRKKSRKEQVRRHEIDLSRVRAELEEAGFEIVEAQDPFTTHPYHDEEWLLVGRRPLN